MPVYVHRYAKGTLDINVFLKKKAHNEILRALRIWII